MISSVRRLPSSLTLFSHRCYVPRRAYLPLYPPFRYGPGGRNGIVRLLCSFAILLRKSSLVTVRLHRPWLLSRSLSFRVVYSETTPQGKKTTKLNQTLLNGNNICMVSALSSALTTGLVSKPHSPAGSGKQRARPMIYLNFTDPSALGKLIQCQFSEEFGQEGG